MQMLKNSILRILKKLGTILNELFLTFQKIFLKIYLEKEMQGNYTKAI